MLQTDPQFKLRLPSDLKARLDESAASANRSLTAEIVHRLQRTFDDDAASAPVPPLEPEVIEMLGAMHTPGTREFALAKRLHDLYDEAKAKAEAQFVAEASEGIKAGRKKTAR